MPRKPAAPKTAPRLHGGEKGLAVKDGLREVRFHMKQGARKLVQAVEAATHRHDDDARGPLGLLGEPLNLAVRTTAHFLSSVDHAAVDALTSGGPYRAMTVQLRSSPSYFRDAGSSVDLKEFTTDHHWRYRHWLALKQIGDVFVHEQAIAVAGARLADDRFAGGTPSPHADAPRHPAVPIIQALMDEAILERPGLLADDGDDELTELSESSAVVVVLAGEIAAQGPELGPRERYLRALQLADEIVTAHRTGWKSALRSLAPADALSRWVDFVLRHV